MSASIWTDAPKNTQQVYGHLVTFARKMRVVTYGEVAGQSVRTRIGSWRP
jgi:hypothetical protein